ncbi:MAG: hypothetical protein AAF604_01395 [Acidobacteriota bacterium]
MGAVTYPDDRVAALLTERFNLYKLDLSTPHEDFRAASGGAPVPWAPTFRFCDRRGREVRRLVGWLPPEGFLAELHLTLGLQDIARGRFADAEAAMGRIADRWPEAAAAPEALYWAGMAAFQDGQRDMHRLHQGWQALRQRYPDSTWAERASVIDDWKGAQAH